jgi:hypothetical protein
VPETGPLRSTWRELETWPWLPDCGPSRKRWNHHRRLPVRAPGLDPTFGGCAAVRQWGYLLQIAHLVMMRGDWISRRPTVK